MRQYETQHFQVAAVVTIVGQDAGEYRLTRNMEAVERRGRERTKGMMQGGSKEGGAGGREGRERGEESEGIEGGEGDYKQDRVAGGRTVDKSTSGKT